MATNRRAPIVPQRGQSVVDQLRRQMTTAQAIAADVSPTIAEQLAAVTAADEPDAGPAPAVVVLVGEVQQGKSSLLNALVGRRGLSPVDRGVATTTYLTVRHGPDEGAQVHLAEENRAQPVALDAVADWATRPGSPVRNIDATATAPWLGTLVLVDTPGAGGLNAVHAEIALAAAARASALLFVTDAGAPLSQIELEFLQRAAERVNAVLFALTKVDRYRGWAQVLAENRANLERVAPRFRHAPWFPIDSALAQDVLDELAGRHPSELPPATDADPALEDWADCGVAELLGALSRDVAPAAERNAVLNRARLVRSRLDELARIVAERVAAIEVDPALRAAVVAEEARLTRWLDEQKTWSPELERRIRHLQLSTQKELNQEVTALEGRWSARLRELRRAPDEQVMQDMLDELRTEVGALAADAQTRLGTGFAAIATQLFAELATSPVTAEIGRIERDIDLPARALLPPRQRVTVQEWIESPMGGMMGFNLGGAAVGLLPAAVLTAATAGAAAVTGGLLVGAAMVGGRMWARRNLAVVRDLQVAVSTWTAKAAADIRLELERDVLDARYLITTSFRTALEQRIAEIRELVRVQKAAADLDVRTKREAQQKLALSQKAIATTAAALDTHLDAPPRAPALTAPARPTATPATATPATATPATATPTTATPSTGGGTP